MKVTKKSNMTKLFFSERKFDSNGFSLVEGITALAVLSFCVAVSLPLFASTFKSSDQNSQEVQAVARVSTLVEQFRATAPTCDQITELSYNGPVTDEETGEQTDELEENGLALRIEILNRGKCNETRAIVSAPIKITAINKSTTLFSINTLILLNTESTE